MDFNRAVPEIGGVYSVNIIHERVITEPERLCHNFERAGQANSVFRNITAISENFHAGFAGFIKFAAIFRIDIAGQIKALAIRAVHTVKHNGAMSLPRHFGQFPQMFGPARRRAVGEFRKRRAARKRDVFDFNVTKRPGLVFEEYIDAAILAVFDLAPQRPVTAELWYQAGLYSGFDNFIGRSGVDANIGRADLYDVPIILQLAFRVVRCCDPDDRAFILHAHHGTCVGAMGGDDLAVQVYVGQKPFVAFDQTAFLEGTREFHIAISMEHPHIGGKPKEGLMDTTTVTAGVILIGDELLSGRTRDTNLGDIAWFLEPLGVQVGEARIISDNADTIVETVRTFAGRFDYVFTTGGIGPTHDDITADCIAKAFNVGISERADAIDALRERYGEEELNAARRRMARIPDGASLIKNPVSQAPGFQTENVFTLAGVPGIMRGMLQDIGHRIKGGAAVYSRTVLAAGIGEGDAAGPLAEIEKAYSGVSIGSYPFFDENMRGANFVARGRDQNILDQVEADLKALVETLGA